MDQEKMGKFMLEMRKQKGLTQKELAEQIGISDKTISKWECGNSIPDISYLEPLCHSLEISVNELLSGEHLTEESYSEKAEENIMALMKENEKNKKTGFWRKVFGILAACVGMAILIFSRNQEVRVLQYYINYFTLLVFGLLCVAGVLLSGKKTKMEILSVLQKIVVPNGVLIALIQVVNMLRDLDEPSAIGPIVSACILSILYGVSSYLVVTILKLLGEKEEK